MPFKKIGISVELRAILRQQDFSTPTPIQKQAIPQVLKGKDVMAIAKTGSGKTLAYVLPILMNLEKARKKKNRFVSVLILVPTRELAGQVNEVIKTYSNPLPNRIKSLAVFGGVSINPQMKAMSGVDILVATPGRLLDLVNSNAVHLSEIDCLVLDEADKMLNLGFKQEMDDILSFLPKKRQNLLFSATLSEKVDKVAISFLKNPIVVKVEDQAENLDLINQLAYFVTEDRKGPLLRFLIESKGLKQVLVFTSSVFMADKVAHKLNKNGIEASSIHSKKSQGSRTESLRRFKSGHLNVLVATDLLARGIDVEFLPCVINYELPRSPKDYIHRIGRTGRAENAGIAFSFIEPDAEHHFKIIQKKMNKRVEMVESKNLRF